MLREIKVQKGTRQDYYKLADFHYRSHRLPPTRKIFCAERDGEVIGVIVYSYPPPTVFGRKKVLPEKRDMRELNRILSIVSRVVVHPKYRSIGLGQKLVRETLTQCGTPNVETIAVMARYNPFFERAGMRKICEQPPAKAAVRIASQLPRFGFDLERISSYNCNLSVLKRLSERELFELKLLIGKHPHPRLMKHFLARVPFGSKQTYARAIGFASREKLAGLIRVIGMLCQAKVYLFWRNPKWEEKLSR